MGKVDIITLGCRLNIAESAAIRAQITDVGAQDDAIIINSCAVTHAAERETRKAIRRARRDAPNAKIIVTGCAAQIDPAAYASMAEVDAVIGNANKSNPAAFSALFRSNSNDKPVRVNDIMTVQETAPQFAASFSDHARGFVEVQNGCDHRCTFCVIPYGRGNSRSVPAGGVIDAVKRLVDEGRQEIVLTGVDVTSYGPDLPGSPSLGLLVERILKAVPELPRLRLSSLDSVEIDDRLFALLTSDVRVMPHVHLSLQAGDDMILKRMKRRHNRQQAIDLVAKLKTARPDMSIGADVIAGFPTEDDAMFANSLALVEECDIVFGHIFPYSPRISTPAARMPQLPDAVIRDRAAQLRTACDARKLMWLKSLIGTTQQVLIEKSGLSGHAENFAMVRFAQAQPVGQIIAAQIIGVADGGLIGESAA
jgi:threonylcarbamoyladenosine tRNA methylthiotransferase MtaB